MLPEKSLQIIKTRSQTLKALLELNDKAKEVKILEILKELPTDDDAYYLGYLYGLLIDLYLKQGVVLEFTNFNHLEFSNKSQF